MVAMFKKRFPENNRPVEPLNGRALVTSTVGLPGEFGSMPAPPPALAPTPAPSPPAPAPAAPKGKGEWDYAQGAKDWSTAFPLCAGKEQTPIDLDDRAVSSRGGEQLSKLMNYTPLKDRELFNNGGKNVQVNGGFGFLKLPDGQYDAKQFHFHFPSEHSANGKLAAGELHIVHQKKGSTGTNDLAVIGILLQESDGDMVKSPETDFMKSLGFGDELPGSGTRLKVAEPLDLNAFKSEFAGRFYHYAGSLTTPPCSEKVHWYVCERPALVSKDMVASFKKRFPENNRPVQPLNSRTLVSNGVSVPGEF